MICMIRWMMSGRVHEAFFRQMDTAELAFGAFHTAGFEPELWQGSTRVK